MIIMAYMWRLYISSPYMEAMRKSVWKLCESQVVRCGSLIWCNGCESLEYTRCMEARAKKYNLDILLLCVEAG
jgi:hypothetical protein